jgi:hypothetical protein
MTDETEPNVTPAKTPEPGKDSTVTDWHGQEVDRDAEAADEAIERADGDEAEAEEIFDQIRPDHESDEFKVPAGEREGTVNTARDADAEDDTDDERGSGS